MNTIRTLSVAAIAAISFFQSRGQSAPDGQALFKQNCAACHSIGKGKLVGPDLKDVQTRHKAEWIVKWVKSSQALVKSGDKDAVKLFSDNNSIPMPDQPLNPDEIKAVLTYIEKTGSAPAEDIAQANVAKKEIVVSKNTVKEEKSLASVFANFSFVDYFFMLLAVLLVIAVYIMSTSIVALKNELKAKR